MMPMLAESPLSPLRPQASCTSGTLRAPRAKASAVGSGPPTAGSVARSSGLPASCGAATCCVPMSMLTPSCDLGTRHENSRTTGCTLGRPPVKPVIAGDVISAIGATSRENSSSASFSGWRTPTLSITSRADTRACAP
jgi:hypothetical protein